MSNVQKQFIKEHTSKTGAGDLLSPVTITYQTAQTSQHGEPKYVQVGKTRAKIEVDQGSTSEQGIGELIRSTTVTVRKNSLPFLDSSISPTGFIIHVGDMISDATIKVEDTLELNDFFIMRGYEGIHGDSNWPPKIGGIAGVPVPGHPTHPIVKRPKPVQAQVNNTHLQIIFDSPVTSVGNPNDYLQVQYPDANGHIQNRVIKNAVTHDKTLVVEISPTFEKQDLNITVKYAKTAGSYLQGGLKVKNFTLPVKNVSTFVAPPVTAPGLLSSVIDQDGNIIITYDNALATTGQDRSNNVKIRVNSKDITPTKITVTGTTIKVKVPGAIFHSDLVEYEYQQHTGSSIIDHINNLELMPQTYVVTNNSQKVRPIGLTPTYTMNVGPTVHWNSPTTIDDHGLATHDSALYGQTIPATGAKMREDTGIEWLPKGGIRTPAWYVFCFSNAQNGCPTIAMLEHHVRTPNGARHDGWVLRGNKIIDPTDKAITENAMGAGTGAEETAYDSTDIPHLKYQDKTIVVVKVEKGTPASKMPDFASFWYNGYPAQHRCGNTIIPMEVGVGVGFLVFPDYSVYQHNSADAYLHSIRVYDIKESESDILGIKWG